MSFSDLSSATQDVLLVNHSYVMKILVFFVLIFFSCYYLFVVWKKHEPTKYITVVLGRIFAVSLSFVYLVASPVTLLLLSPEYDFYSFYNLPLKFYGIFMSLVLVILFVDMMRYGFIGMLKLAGLDVGDDNANELISQIENNKHFLKFKKRAKW